MADPNDPSKPLSGAQAKRLALAILEHGTTIITPHAQRRQDERDVDTPDIENVLRGGVFQFAEWNHEHDENRYRFETSSFGVVCAFDDDDEHGCLTVVTTWRKTR